MFKTAKYKYIAVAAVLLVLMVPALYPFYHNYIDPDGVAYLTISKRYADGDFFRAVNGYWSPWSCWLTALLIRLAIPAVAASIVVNTVGALGYLVVSDSLFRCFGTATTYRRYILAALTLFLCFASRRPLSGI